ncbi:putative F-box protein At3g16210 [Bidens hawaiensis]|uniref:putative F-box protein At3g16210 n=1 Tax=Bidens hawaiensis TaxID=980011 RepID=UPI004049A781
MAGMYNHVPEDIVFAILVRMPIKPLLRLRCLSKHWNHTISDHFMKSRSRRMILLPFKPLQVMDTAAHSVSELPFPNFINPGSEDRLIIGGTYNGIMLLVHIDMILYNPLTGAYKTVPNPPPLESSTSTNYGFCYGTSLDDLKIVRLINERSGFDQESRWCDVFSLKKGSWSTTSRTLVRAFYTIDYAGTFVNGFLYWRAVRGNMHLIVALDVKEMVFSEIQIPTSSRLGTLGGRLHVFLDIITKFELWVMNEHGMEKPWSKALMTTNALTGYSIPLLIMGAGKIVMLRIWRRKPKHIIIYDMLNDSEEIYEVQAGALGKIWKSHAMEYVESLISPSHLCSNLI